eukprot:COSAG05_NODE_24702_length_231_cov_1.280303_1_plen_77_part_11
MRSHDGVMAALRKVVAQDSGAGMSKEARQYAAGFLMIRRPPRSTQAKDVAAAQKAAEMDSGTGEHVMLSYNWNHQAE